MQRLSRGTYPASAEQLVLIGQPRPIRVPERRWRSWLDDPTVVARFESKRYKRAEDQCWVWIAAVSSTGHGSFRAVLWDLLGHLPLPLGVAGHEGSIVIVGLNGMRLLAQTRLD